MPTRSFCIRLALACALIVSDPFLASAAPWGGPAWTRAEDDQFWQESSRQILTESPPICVGSFTYNYNAQDYRAYAGFEDGLKQIKGSELLPVEGAPAGPIRDILGTYETLWVVNDAGLHRLFRGEWKLMKSGRVAALSKEGPEGVLAAIDGALWRGAKEKIEAIPGSEGAGTPIAIERVGESIYLLNSGGLAIWDGRAFDSVDVVDRGRLPSPTPRAMKLRREGLLIATERGLAHLRGMALTTIRGAVGLPIEDVTSLSGGRAGLEIDWIGTSQGLIRRTSGRQLERGGLRWIPAGMIREEFDYFAGPRWMPSDRVIDIGWSAEAVGPVVATEKGLGLIEELPYTLAKKAAFYERHLDEWGQKRLGFVHKLEWDEGLKQWVREISDNDAGWSAEYLAAMSFKYAATKDEAAYAEALNTFNALKWSEEISLIRGFPARSIWAKGETGHKANHGSGGYPAEWHDATDKRFEWKADTSSDEIDAQFFGVAIFHDFAAKEADKPRAQEHLARIATHIIESGWYLKDMDGKPTRWGRWEPEYLQRPEGYYARGLNGMEVLAYMRTAHALTGDPKFEKAVQDLVAMGYHKEILRQKLTEPPDFVNHSDDRMAFMIYYLLMRYEKDPYLRGLYERSLERSWEIERPEKNPFFNFVYGISTGRECEIEAGAQHLRDWPLDLVRHPFRNSHRADLEPRRPEDRSILSEVRALSPRERGPMRWSDNPFELDGGSGKEVNDPSCWLLAYWMARAANMIAAPSATEPELISVEKRNLQLGAKPYDGPARP